MTMATGARPAGSSFLGWNNTYADSGQFDEGAATRTTMVSPRGIAGQEAVSLRTFDNKYNDGRREAGGAGGSPHPIQINGIRGDGRSGAGSTTEGQPGRGEAGRPLWTITIPSTLGRWERLVSDGISWYKTCSKGPRPEGCKKVYRPKKKTIRDARGALQRLDKKRAVISRRRTTQGDLPARV